MLYPSDLFYSNEPIAGMCSNQWEGVMPFSKVERDRRYLTSTSGLQRQTDRQRQRTQDSQKPLLGFRVTVMVLHRWPLECLVDFRGSHRLCPGPCYLQTNQRVRTETTEWVGISIFQSSLHAHKTRVTGYHRHSQGLPSIDVQVAEGIHLAEYQSLGLITAMARKEIISRCFSKLCLISLIQLVLLNLGTAIYVYIRM